MCLSKSAVAVLLNRGKASFIVSNEYAIGGSPADLCLGDFNSDGKVDFAAANSTAGDVSVFFNTGKGKFGDELHISLPEKPLHLVCSDLNGDSKPDLAITSANSLFILLNSGKKPYFAEHKDTNLTNSIENLVLADFNADGAMDIALVSAPSKLWIFLNDGKADLRKKVTYKTGVLPRAIVVLDVNRDSKPDLVTANKKSQDLSVFAGRGDGTFGAEMRHAVRMEPSAMFAADLDSNGEGADLAVVSNRSGSLAVLINIYGKKQFK